MEIIEVNVKRIIMDGTVQIPIIHNGLIIRKKILEKKCPEGE